MLRKRARFSGEFIVNNANESVEIKQVYVRSSVNGNFSVEVVLTSKRKIMIFALMYKFNNI